MLLTCIIRTHCFNHKLNLVLVDSSRQLNFVGDTLEILSSIYNFFSGSAIPQTAETVEDGYTEIYLL